MWRMIHDAPHWVADTAPADAAKGSTAQAGDTSKGTDGEEVQGGYGGQTYHAHPDGAPGKSTEPVESQESA
jgi:hypothetical protein